jgi:UDP-N-acetylglucosamine 2-epimerase (non-hydrolysing)
LKKVKVFFILGTRPEVIKLAPLVLAFLRREEFEVRLINTGQHREMSSAFLRVFNLNPHYDLQVMAERQSLSYLTSKIMEELERVFLREKPDFVFVQGDTTTALCGALSAFYFQIPLGHVEAGLRTREKWRPFPEEMNRVLITRLADFHFAPTLLAKKNLLQEGVTESQILLAGNTVVDALFLILNQNLPVSHPALKQELRKDNPHLLVTVTAHRRENWGEGIKNIASAMKIIAEMSENVKIFFALHPNPSVREMVLHELAGTPRVVLLDGLEYPDFLKLLSQSALVISDSGGVQEEAASLGIPVLITRESTERPEIVETGLGVLVGCRREEIIKQALSFLREGTLPREKRYLFGDGNASLRILGFVSRLFQFSDQDVQEFSPSS